jgi:hypothetical protein
MKRYYIKFPLNAYALGPISARNEREAREQARKLFTYGKRLPRNFECWETK